MWRVFFWLHNEIKNLYNKNIHSNDRWSNISCGLSFIGNKIQKKKTIILKICAEDYPFVAFLRSNFSFLSKELPQKTQIPSILHRGLRFHGDKHIKEKTYGVQIHFHMI